MTQTSNRFFDEIARLMNDAAGVASGVRREVETVVRNQADRILRDLDAVQTPARGAEPDEELSVGDAFVDHPYMVDVTIPLDEVLDEMWEQRIGAALVLKAGKLVGILTAADVCRLFAEHLRRVAKVPPDEVA